MGLVNRLAPGPLLRHEVMELAADIAGNAPLTVAAAKFAISEAGKSAERRDLTRVETMVEACFSSQDYLEGQRAFAQKRSPRFTGH